MADSNLFTVNLVTPERILLEGAASEVILRSGEGDLTILAGHTPLVGSVEPGVIRVVRDDGQVERVAAHGGFVQVEQHVAPESEDGGSGGSSGTRVTLLIGVAELAEEIDAARAQAALEAAEARVAELTGVGRPGHRRRRRGARRRSGRGRGVAAAGPGPAGGPRGDLGLCRLIPGGSTEGAPRSPRVRGSSAARSRRMC